MKINENVILHEAEADNVLQANISQINTLFNNQVSVDLFNIDWDDLRKNGDIESGTGPQLFAPLFSLDYDLGKRGQISDQIVNVKKHFKCTSMPLEKSGWYRLHCVNGEGKYVGTVGWLIASIESTLKDLSTKGIVFDHLTIHVYTLYCC